jgi:hypothetical protein
LIESLGQILDIHKRLEANTNHMISPRNENRTRKFETNAEELSHPTKRQHRSQLPLTEIMSSNLMQTRATD